MPENDRVDIRPLLPGVRKPGRYIGGEVNRIVKSLPDGGVRFAICFPDVYEIGMSYPGLQILYHVLNSPDWCAAERCFAVWTDMEALMRKASVPLFTLETHSPLRSFDIAGFSLQHELSYTQVLAMLDLAGIPLRAVERSPGDPLVVGGGPCAMNPEPLADFFDAFFIGDGEEGAVDVAAAVRRCKSAGAGKGELLRELAGIPGVYVPSLYEVEYEGLSLKGVRAAAGAMLPVSRRALPSIENAPYPARHVVPNVNPVHDRLVVEIQRGCTRGCRFCHAGMTGRPVRMRSPGKILELASEGLKATGHEELSLLSLSAGDYPGLQRLLSELVARHGPERVSLSLPSMRVETMDPALVEEIRKVRKTGFTVAPEAGSQRLRDVVNKCVDEEDLLGTVRAVFGAGWGLIKLYFMAGLPTETDEDIKEISRLCIRALKAARAVNGRARMNVSVTAFVPKAHTPFQWEGMASGGELRSRMETVKSGLAGTGITVSIHSPEQAFVEAVLARGDRRVCAAVEQAFLEGARLESWNENFSAGRWESAFLKMQGVTAKELAGPRDRAARLPWEHLDAGVLREFLSDELDRALKGEKTGDCLASPCMDCGVCTPANGLKPEAAGEAGAPFAGRARAYSFKGSASAGEIRHILRLRYSRRGLVAYLGHLDVMGLWIQAVRRSSLPVAYSMGFHPKARMGMGPACPVGVSSSVEYIDLELERKVDPARAVSMLNAFLVDGLEAIEAYYVPRGTPSLSAGIAFIDYRFVFEEPGTAGEAGARLAGFMALESLMVRRTKEGRTREHDLRKLLLDGRMDECGAAVVRAANTPSGGARISEIFEHALGLSESGRMRVSVERTQVGFGRPDGR